ncbi:MAG: hypothetical protein U0Z75_05410 [Deinococcaceae bacterium]
MKKYGKMIPGIGASCSNLMFSSVENETAVHSKGDVQYFKKIDKGWKEVKNCLSAVNPDTYGKTQVYLAEIETSGVPEVKNVLPISVTGAMTIGHFITDLKSVSVDGTTKPVHYYGEVKQVLYGDKNSMSGKQAVSDGGKRVFLSGAENLYGSQFDMVKIKSAMKNADGYYDNVPPPDVAYILKNPVLKYDPIGGYWWEPKNEYDSIELYYDQKSVKGYVPFIYAGGIVDIEK